MGVPSKQVSLSAGLINVAIPGSTGTGSFAQLLRIKIKPPINNATLFIFIL
jgi:hypothetical protein